MTRQPELDDYLQELRQSDASFAAAFDIVSAVIELGEFPDSSHIEAMISSVLIGGSCEHRSSLGPGYGACPGCFARMINLAVVQRLLLPLKADVHATIEAWCTLSRHVDSTCEAVARRNELACTLAQVLHHLHSRAETVAGVDISPPILTADLERWKKILGGR